MGDPRRSRNISGEEEKKKERRRKETPDMKTASDGISFSSETITAVMLKTRRHVVARNEHFSSVPVFAHAWIERIDEANDSGWDRNKHVTGEKSENKTSFLIGSRRARCDAYVFN